MAPARSPRRLAVSLVVLAAVTVLCAEATLAHGASLGGNERESLSVPTWLFLLTGGAAVGGSFVLASFVTDRSFVAAVHAWHRLAVVPARRVALVLGRLGGVAGLGAVLTVGYLGPTEPLANAAILTVWVGWWAGYTMTTYLVGNTWPAVNPWRTLADFLPSLRRPLPDRFAAWPAVVGLLVLVWVEVVSPVADRPRLLATTVLGYSAVTLAGTAVVGPDRWFGSVDPVARVFRYYGRVAPLTWDGDRARLRLRLPGSGLAGRALDDRSEVAFVVALLWTTTFDGFVSTPAWRRAADAAVGVGVSPTVVYPAALLAGFGLFLAVWRVAIRYSRRLARTYRSRPFLSTRFASSLVPIAAGYHLAHFLEYFVSLAPALGAVVGRPLSPPVTVPVVQVPDWFGAVAVLSVLAGHLLAIWVAHATAYDAFPGRLQAIRSQYPMAAVMVFYTAVSLWILQQPAVQPPYL